MTGPEESAANGDESARADAPTDAPEPTPEERADQRRRRRILILLLTPLFLHVIASYLALALTPRLMARSPLALIALDAQHRNLLLVAPFIDTVPFYVVAILRPFAVIPVSYVLGRRYGDAGVRWVESRFSALKPTIEVLEGLFRRAGWLAVALLPGPVVCVLAGATGMGVGVFVVAAVGGVLARVILLREIGFAFSGPLDSLRGFFDRYLLLATVISVLLVALWIWTQRRQGRIETPGELADDLDAEIEAGRPGPRRAQRDEG